jgi:hypothetical protein
MRKAFKKTEFKLKNCQNYLCLESLGVKIGVGANSSLNLEKLRKLIPVILPIEWKEISRAEAEHWFFVVESKKAPKTYSVYKESDLLQSKNAFEETLNLMETQIRATIAEFAKDFVFLHAGVVSWNDKAIIIPGKSFSGKTTLVLELIKRDCHYLSDEYAVIDRNGFVHPFPKKLSVRGIIDNFKQVDFEVEEFGGKRQELCVPVGYFLLTGFKKDLSKLKIEETSAGEGVMAGVANSISVRQNPELVLEVLSSVAKEARVLRAERGEAGEFAEFLLNYLKKDKMLNLSGVPSDSSI